jgi:hypothetical protein
MTMYRVYFWCEECSIGRPTDVLIARPDPELAGKLIDELYADHEIPPSIRALVEKQTWTCPKGHTKANLTPQDFFLDLPQ